MTVRSLKAAFADSFVGLHNNHFIVWQLILPLASLHLIVLNVYIILVCCYIILLQCNSIHKTSLKYHISCMYICGDLN